MALLQRCHGVAAMLPRIQGASCPATLTEASLPRSRPPAQATVVVAMLEKRAGEELFRKHVATVVGDALAARAAEQGKDGAAAAAAAGPAESPPGAAPGQQQKGESSEGPPTFLLDAVKFLNGLGRWLRALLCVLWRALRAGRQRWKRSAGAAPAWRGVACVLLPNRPDPAGFAPWPARLLCRAGAFRKEMGPFAERWVYGRGVPHVTAAYIYHGCAVGGWLEGRNAERVETRSLRRSTLDAQPVAFPCPQPAPPLKLSPPAAACRRWSWPSSRRAPRASSAAPTSRSAPR